MGSATYNVLGMAGFAHRRSRRNWRSSAKANPSFIVAVKKIANVADLGFVGSAGGRHMPKPYECRNLIEVSLVAAPLWLYKPGSGRQKQR